MKLFQIYFVNKIRRFDKERNVKAVKEERKKILGMVKNGQISIEEAEKLLEELEKIETVIKENDNNQASELAAIEEFESSHKYSDTNDQGTNYSKSSNFAKEAKETLFNLFEGAKKKLKEMDLDFHHSVNVSHVFQQNAADFNDIFVEIPNGSVQVSVWDHTDVRVECEGKVYREEDPISGKERFLNNIEFVVDEKGLTFLSKEKFMKVDTKIYVPQREYAKVYVKVFNGSIMGESVNSKKFNVQTSNGQMRLSGCVGETADLETANGSITLTQCAIQKLETETVNGKITIDGQYEEVEAESISGAIHVYAKDEGLKSAKLSSGTGGIQMYVVKGLPMSGEIKSNFGNVTVNIENLYKIDESKEMIQKTIKFDTTADLHNKVYLFAESKTGSVVVKHF